MAPISMQKGLQGMGQRDPSVWNQGQQSGSGIGTRTHRDGSRGFWELLAGTEAEVGGDLQSPKKELSQVTSAVSGHRAP